MERTPGSGNTSAPLADALNNKQVLVNRFASGLDHLKITDPKGIELANLRVFITKQTRSYEENR